MCGTLYLWTKLYYSVIDFSASTSSVTVIRTNANLSDAGRYECIAVNKTGKRTLTFNISVNGRL